MKQIKLLCLSLVALTAVSAVAAASAFAVEELVLAPTTPPTATEPLEFTSSSGAGELLTLKGKFVKCTKSTGSGKFTSGTLGTYKVLFEGCTGESGTTCTGVGDKAGTIAQEGEVHYGLRLLSGVEQHALEALVKEFHFTCEVIGIKILVLVRGCISALAEPIGSLTAKTKDVAKFTAAKSGDPDVASLCTEKEPPVKVGLLSSIGGGAFEGSGLEGTAENTNFKRGGKAVEVELMS